MRMCIYMTPVSEVLSYLVHEKKKPSHFRAITRIFTICVCFRVYISTKWVVRVGPEEKIEKISNFDIFPQPIAQSKQKSMC